MNRARVRTIRVRQLPFCNGVPLVLRHVSSHCSSFGAECNKASGKCRIIGVAEDFFFLICFVVCTTRASPVGIPWDIYRICFYVSVCMYIYFHNCLFSF